ncbi:MAG: hypothetical protein LBD09_02080 [Treponema sp.]|jgi:hypothetical protein|nr:hypothetical protein [Treponema sp.]
MGFSDTLRELLDQGLAVSRDLAARAGEKAQDLSVRGLEAAGEFAVKAGAKVQELGEKGVLALEIKQLESQAKKLLGLLGAEAYSLYERGGSWNQDEPGLRNIFDEIAAVRNVLEQKEADLKNRGKKDPIPPAAEGEGEGEGS